LEGDRSACYALNSSPLDRHHQWRAATVQGCTWSTSLLTRQTWLAQAALRSCH